ncbi:hypothetical protein GIB67_020847 [Kingdonia uniflora]|uniref:Potassium transporter n=1 Tax=Kingdonia uniflora TaxID=39325 RepID=A0A7J7M7L0_9MAGN|nr:hypothetical protein GIB67_020847 [Kingdonia uniflora]
MYYTRLRSSWDELSHYDSFIEWSASAPSEMVSISPTTTEIYAKIVEKTRVFWFLAVRNSDFEIPSETSAMAVRYAYPAPPSVPSQTSHTSSPSISSLPAASGRQPPTPDCQASSVAPGLPPAIDSPLSGVEPSPAASIPVITDNDSPISHRSEAMFADLGHLSKKSIKFTFVSFVYPALLLSYAGQAAFISKNGHFSKNKANVIHAVFRKKCEGHYLLEENVMAVPVQLRHVFTVLSLLASIVGSQATITATFSIIKQCLALGCFPRVKIIHTSNKIHGQVYIPDVNWILMVLCLTLVVVFQEIGLIANATGLAIILGMLVTTFLMSLVITLHWEKSIAVSACFLIFFGFIEVLYLCACLLSFHKGAWYLVVLVAISLSTMLAWHYGTMKKYESDLQNKVSMDWLTNLSPGLGVARVPGIGFIYTDIVTGIPGFFSHFVTNLPAFHQILIFVTFKSVPVPFVPPSRRYLIGRVGPNEYRVYRCIVRNGYCERIRDTDDFEDQLISTIGEFITIEENDIEDLSSSEGRMIVIGNPRTEGKNALIPLGDSCSTVGLLNLAHNESPMTQFGECSRFTPNRRKKVRFLVPQEKTRMQTSSVRQELQELEDARESGTAYFLGQSHLVVRDGSNFVKQFLVMIYVFLNKNCREHPVALNIPHAALVEVGMVYAV